MELSLVAANAGAIVTLGLGFVALLKPHWIASFTSIKPVGSNGVSEIRATYGGFFIVLGLSCLLSQDDSITFIVGLAWIGASVGRVFSIIFDRNTQLRNIGGVAFEAAVGLLLISPTLF